MAGLRDNLYLVTGGCGFIGSHLCEGLLAAGARVRILDNMSSGRETNLETFRGRVDWQVGDVRDPTAVARAVAGVRGIFHEAALVSVADSMTRPRDYHEVNLTGTLHVLQAAHAAGVRRVLFAGTSATYGNDPALPKTEDLAPQPCSPYAAAKTGSELYMTLYAQAYDLETVTLRYFNVYGPRQDASSPYSGVISLFVRACREGRPPVVYGDGRQTRDFVYVAHVVRANLLAMAASGVGRGEVFNVAGGRAVSLLELLHTLSALTGCPIAPQHAAARSGEVRHSLASIGRAQKVLGYRPETALEDGLRALLEDEDNGPRRRAQAGAAAPGAAAEEPRQRLAREVG